MRSLKWRIGGGGVGGGGAEMEKGENVPFNKRCFWLRCHCLRCAFGTVNITSRPLFFYLAPPHIRNIPTCYVGVRDIVDNK